MVDEPPVQAAQRVSWEFMLLHGNSRVQQAHEPGPTYLVHRCSYAAERLHRLVLHRSRQVAAAALRMQLRKVQLQHGP